MTLSSTLGNLESPGWDQELETNIDIVRYRLQVILDDHRALEAFTHILTRLKDLQGTLDRKRGWRTSQKGRTCRSCGKSDTDTAFGTTDLCDNCYRRGNRLGWCPTCRAALYKHRQCQCGNFAHLPKP